MALAAAAQAYIDVIPPAMRPLFDRVHGLIVGAYPDVSVVISYGMPTYGVGPRRLYVGAWKQWVSLYGWGAGQDGGFVARHPELFDGKGTIRLRPRVAAALADDDLLSLIHAALGGIQPEG